MPTLRDLASDPFPTLRDVALRLATRGLDAERAAERAERATRGRRPARRLVRRYARRQALRGALLGVPGGLWSVPLGLLDLGGALQARTELAAALHVTRDPAFLERDDWRARALATAWDVRLEAGSKKALAKDAVTSAARDLGGRKLARQAIGRIATKTVPVVGAALGGVAGWLWMRREGARMSARVDERPTERDRAAQSAAAASPA